MAVDNTKNFAEYVNKLGEVADVSIAKFQDMIDALQKRMISSTRMVAVFLTTELKSSMMSLTLTAR